MYFIVQNKVNEKLGSSFRYQLNEKSIEILAKRVIKGEFGNGNIRKTKLGDSYPNVQNKVNEILECPTRINIKETSIEQYAKEVIRGAYGGGEERKSLGIYMLLSKIK